MARLALDQQAKDVAARIEAEKKRGMRYMAATLEANFGDRRAEREPGRRRIPRFSRFQHGPTDVESFGFRVVD